MGAKYVGAAVLRREDPRLLRGSGRYVDDIQLPGLLHVAFLRSPHAHALVRGIHADGARQSRGVVEVFTFDSLARWMTPLPNRSRTAPGLAAAIDFQRKDGPQYPLVQHRARYVGEIVAMVVAESRYLAEDALDSIEVEYEPLPAVVDPLAAGEPGAELLHPDWGDNVALAFSHTLGDPEAAFQAAEVVVSDRFTIQRYVGMPIEPRGVIARFDRRDGTLTTWNSTQLPHFVQQHLASVFGLPPHQVRVIAPDVGGGFGTKAHGYAEDVLVPLAARALGRPVKWTEDRREHFTAAAHARAQVHDISLAARSDGTVLGLRDRIWVDVGAYNLWFTIAYNTVGHLIGPHRITNMGVELNGVVTNKMPQAPYRGAGRPEAVFAVDRIVDRLARELRMDSAELRRRNYLRPDELPYDVGIPYLDGSRTVYDSADFTGALEKALDRAEYERFRTEQQALRAKGVYRGIGVSGYVEGTGLGPYEMASVRLDASGRAVIATGCPTQGQGLETAFSQVVADKLGIQVDWVTVADGDTTAIPLGLGSFASRSIVMAGNALATAAQQVREQLLQAAAQVLEAAAEDLEIEDGQVRVAGVSGRSLSFAEVIRACVPTFAAPGVAPPRFEATAQFCASTVTFASGVHVAQVEVDRETGLVKLLKYVVAHDCGRVVNPMIVEGQIHGGVAQGIGGALFEDLVYSEHGQLLTTSLMDYLLPTALDLPRLETAHLECPSPLNPMGVKGMGEGGAVSPPAAVANAVEDALAPFGVRVTRTPLGPDYVVALLRRDG